MYISQLLATASISADFMLISCRDPQPWATGPVSDVCATFARQVQLKNWPASSELPPVPVVSEPVLDVLKERMRRATWKSSMDWCGKTMKKRRKPQIFLQSVLEINPLSGASETGHAKCGCGSGCFRKGGGIPSGSLWL